MLLDATNLGVFLRIVLRKCNIHDVSSVAALLECMDGWFDELSNPRLRLVPTLSQVVDVPQLMETLRILLGNGATPAPNGSVSGSSGVSLLAMWQQQAAGNAANNNDNDDEGGGSSRSRSSRSTFSRVAISDVGIRRSGTAGSSGDSRTSSASSLRRALEEEEDEQLGVVGDPLYLNPSIHRNSQVLCKTLQWLYKHWPVLGVQYSTVRAHECVRLRACVREYASTREVVAVAPAAPAAPGAPLVFVVVVVVVVVVEVVVVVVAAVAVAVVVGVVVVVVVV
jgi:hypothetical protein